MESGRKKWSRHSGREVGGFVFFIVSGSVRESVSESVKEAATPGVP